MRILELIQDGTAALRLAAILAGGVVLWLLWIARNERTTWAHRVRHRSATLKRHAGRRRNERCASGALAELERLRQIGAI